MNLFYPLQHVGTIPSYQPGRPVNTVARELGLDPAQIVKLASNENPSGCSPAVTNAINALSRHTSIYPDFDTFDLRHAIANDVGVGPDQVLPAAGSSEIIALAAQALLAPGLNAVIPRHSFQAYQQFTRAVGAEPIVVPTRGDWLPDVEAIIAAVDRHTRIVFLGTPNNPTGAVLPPAMIGRLVEALPKHALLLIDEAYREFLAPADRPDTVAMLTTRVNLLVTRTFSKIHGMAGLRIGYGFGHPLLLQILRRLQPPFSVNSIAQAAAIAALGDPGFAERSRLTNYEERDRLAKAFATRGIEHLPSGGNFILFRVGDGASVTRALMQRGVIVRAVGNCELPEWVRVSIGLRAQNDVFIARLDDALSHQATLAVP